MIHSLDSRCTSRQPAKACPAAIVSIGSQEGTERAALFTLDPFADTEKLPLPGPVYIHADGCERYPETAGIPVRLMSSPRTLNAYARGRRLVGPGIRRAPHGPKCDREPVPPPRRRLRSRPKHHRGMLHIPIGARLKPGIVVNSAIRLRSKRRHSGPTPERSREARLCKK